MNKKSFFQGLGLGVLIASVVFLVLYSTREKTETVPQEETVAQTETQTESSLLDLPQRTETFTQVQTVEEIQTIGEISRNEDMNEISTVSGDIPGVDNITVDENGTANIKITHGETASQVYEKLYKAGIIDDEEGFSDFVKENNLSTRRIGSGEYEIPKGADYKEIYDIIKSN